MQLYRVGGCVRDELLGCASADVDYVAVPDTPNSADDAWAQLLGYLDDNGYVIVSTHRACLTINAKLARSPTPDAVLDFVLARREIGVLTGRTPRVELGSLEDDLRRRDFTINAMARSVAEPDTLIDPFCGEQHLRERRLVALGDPLASLMHDPLRLLRALRFCVTKGFEIDEPLWAAMCEPAVLQRFEESVSLDLRRTRRL